MAEKTVDTNEKKVKKENFFHKAFREMSESAKAQHEVDKANLGAVNAESKANFEENRFTNSLARAKANSKKSWDDAHMSVAEKRAKEQEKRDAQIIEANERKAQAEKRIADAKAVRANAKKSK